MSSRRHSGQHELGAEDPAFQPSSPFDFEEDLNHHGNRMSGYNPLSGSSLDFDMGQNFGDEFNSEYFHHQNGDLDYDATVAHARLSNEASRLDRSMSDFHGHVDPPSKQSSIVGSRNGHVAQVHGQITPPDELVPQPFKLPRAKQTDSQQSQSHDSGKLSNEQRARNAANTRHSRTKSTKKKPSKEEDANSDTETQKQKNLNHQREKNRVAAAKCRAKKKTANEQQEEMANEFGATNNVLTREIRDLKNQRTELQNYLLAHRPGMCECHGIHDYNLGQAQRLVLNARRQVAEPQPSSPSQESALSAQSSGSDAAGMIFARSSPLVPPSVIAMQPQAQSFNSPMDYGFNPMSTQAGMQGGFSSHDEGQELHREFAEFLQSSPNGGKAGFS